MRSCLNLFPQSAINYHHAPTKSSDVEAGPMSAHAVSTSPSFIHSLSAMLTSTFSQTATSSLTVTAPPPSRLSPDKLNAVGLDTGVALLHNHVAFVRLNPIVTDCHAVAADSDEGRRLNVPKLLAEFADGDMSLAATTTTPPTTTTTTTTTTTAGAASPTDTESAYASGWTHYAVADALPHPFGLPGTTVLRYTIALRNLPNGLESLVASPGGVTIHGDIRVVRASEGRDAETGWRDPGEKKLWLQERADVRCWVGTAWYVRKTLGDSHESAHERFRTWWEKEVRSRVATGADAGH